MDFDLLLLVYGVRVWCSTAMLDCLSMALKLEADCQPSGANPVSPVEKSELDSTLRLQFANRTDREKLSLSWMLTKISGSFGIQMSAQGEPTLLFN